MKRTLCLLATAAAAASYVAAGTVAITSTCTESSSDLTSTEIGGGLLTVQGPLKFTATGDCEISWTVSRLLQLAAGTYSVGQTFDFSYSLSTMGPAVFDMNMTTSLGEIGGLGTGFGLGVNESGSFYYSVSTEELAIVYPLVAGEYLLTQQVVISVRGEPEIPFTMTAELHFPQDSFVVKLPDPVPEPATFALAGAAIAAFLLRRRR